MKSKILSLAFTFTISFVLVFSTTFNHFATGDTTYDIPSWLKNNAKWWSENKISNEEYVAGIKYLLEHNLVSLEPVKVTQYKVSDVKNSENYKRCQDRTFPRVDWSNCNFEGANLNHADLANANLVGINLSHAILAKAYLFRAHLENSNLDKSDMTNIDMPGADLTNASLVNTIAPFSNLHFTIFDNANLTASDFHESAFSWGTLRGTILKNTTLDHAEFVGVDLSGADLRGASLAMADFNGANLTNANLDGAYLHSANFGGADLTGAKLHCKENPICE